VVTFGSAHSDSMNSCLLYRPGKGRNSVVEFGCSLDGRVWVKGSVKGRTEEFSHNQMVANGSVITR
jgi:hypothetical protein